MNAMVLDRQAGIATKPLAPRSLPDPLPGPHEIVVRVAACGICRTDLHVIEGDLPPHRLPLVPGHQVVGRVDAAGDGAMRFKLGDRVGIAWLHATCGACVFCSMGAENLCERSLYTGWDADGGYAERAVVHEDYAYAIPAAFADDEAAPLLCAGIIGYRALARSRVPAGGRLGLYGFGSSAHIVAQLAKARGCSLYVATRGEAHRAAAEELGAAWVGGATDVPPVALDAAIVFAPAGEIVPPALAALRKGGTVALAGIHMSPIPAMDYGPHLFHEKTLTSVESNTRADGEALLREAAAIPLRPRVASFPLAEANEALAALAGDGFRGTAVLVPLLSS
ncbi:MAG TPA: zinc-dependent alcohol dehydrogenase family protein [Candidatus Polarisedimenticolaceae bacterium]|nr:zinc-dependent alcohol dehydrogenase family protein [Candidatus Polarisedimenticolaceae bacterium]